MQQPLPTTDAQAAVTQALRRLVSADLCNYQRDTMRYEGLFDDARTALAALDGTSVPAPHRGRDPLLRALTDIVAVAEKVDSSAEPRVVARALAAVRALAEMALDPANW